MKQLLITAVLIGALLSSGAVFSQHKQNDDKHAQMMEMMKDSTMMEQMMEYIAADGHRREMMMQRMMQSVEGDSTQMMGMCKMMMGDHDMHGMMMKMMGGGMMKNGMMKGNPQTAEIAVPEIIVKFKPDVTDAQLKEMESESGLEKIKEIPGLNMKVYRNTSSKSAEEVIEAFQKHPFVVYAELNQEYRTMEIKSSNNKKNDDHQEHHPN